MQRTRERLTERAARLALAFVLACGLMLPTAALMARPDQAWAATGTVTINNVPAGITLQAWQVFTADIGINDKAEQIAWSIEGDTTTNKMKNVVLAHLDSLGDASVQGSYRHWLAVKGHTASTAHDDPQNAAEYINAMVDGGYTWNDGANSVSGSSNDTNYDTTLGTESASQKIGRTVVTGGNDEQVHSKVGSSFAYGLANAIAKSQHATTGTWSGNTLTAGEGLYLIAANTSSIDAVNESGTAPIWMPLGGSTESIDIKVTTYPTITIEAWDDKDSTAAWTTYADANANQDITYRMIGTLPANYASYPSYKYVFTDDLNGIELKGADTSSVKVYVSLDGTFPSDSKSVSTSANMVDVTSAITTLSNISYASDTLTVTIPDLMTLAGVSGNTTQASKVAVYYEAHLKSTASMGSDFANTSTAKITYSADPLERDTSSGLVTEDTTAAIVSTYAYRLVLTKYDKSNGEPLNNAVFSVTVKTGNSDADSVGKYVKNDGSLVAAATAKPADVLGNDYKFTTATGWISPTNAIYTNAQYTATGVGALSDDVKNTLMKVSYVEIPLVDEGTYLIHEESSPDPGVYDTQDADITVQVQPDYTGNKPAAFTQPTAISGGETSANVNDDKMGTRLGFYNLAEGDNGHYTTAKVIGTDSGSGNNIMYSPVNPSIGTITMMTVDPKMIKMPLTGLPGYVGIAILGFVLVVCGFGGIFALRRIRAKRDLD